MTIGTALSIVRTKIARTIHPAVLRIRSKIAKTVWMMTRMAAFGHGENHPMTAAMALGIAARATPKPLGPLQPFDEDPALGTVVRIRADDYGRETVEGELVLIDWQEIAIRRNDTILGELVVHFPRFGYDLREV